MKSTNKKQTEPNWRRVAELYEEAIALQGEVRVIWLEKIKNAEPENFASLHTLLLEEPKIKKFLAKSAANGLKISVERKEIPNFKIGDTIGEYTIEGKLGEGGTAKVYLATDRRLQRRVAIKVFINYSEEAKTLASLEHDNIVKVFTEEVLEKDELRLISMQYISGPSLDFIYNKLKSLSGKGLSGACLLDIVDSFEVAHSKLAGATMGREEAHERNEISDRDFADTILILGSKMCDALSYAHSQNVLHLDVKPSNILLNRFGRVFLTDFGVSLTNRVKDLTSHLGGTPKYMPPEQMSMFDGGDLQEVAQSLKPSTDLYSLGLVLKEFLVLPVRAEFKDREYLDWVLSKATSQEQKKRFQSAQEFKKALQSVSELRITRRTLWSEDSTKWYARHPLLTLTLIGAIPQIAASIIGVIYNQVRIVNHLSGPQMALFHWLNFILTPAIFAGISIVWATVLLKLRKYALNPISFSNRPELVIKMRKHLLRVPHWGVLVTSLGWLPAALIYPLALHFFAGGITLSTFVHFACSFTLSWFIALTYSYVLHVFICIKLLYKEFWYGCSDILITASNEVSNILLPVKTCLKGIILGPLVAAVFLVATTQQDVTPSEWRLNQFLVVSLIILGALGTYFAASLGQSLVRTLVQLGKKF